MPSHTSPFQNITCDMFKRAIQASAPQLGVKPDQVIEELHKSRCYECDVLRANLAREVANFLAEVDSDLRAVYFYNPEYAVGDYDSPFAEPNQSSALYLMVWTQTVDSIPAGTIDGLTEAFDKARMALLCENASQLCFSLDLAVVGDAQVRERQGYAVMIDSFNARPIQVWPPRSG